jgi:hypothetical protein
MLIYYLTGCIRLKSFRSRSAPRAMHSVLWDGQSAMAGSRCFVLSCSAPSEKQRCTLTGSFRFLTLTDSFLDISSVPPTYCPSPWCGRFTLKQTRGHSRYGRTKPGGTVEARLACTDFYRKLICYLRLTRRGSGPQRSTLRNSRRRTPISRWQLAVETRSLILSLARRRLSKPMHSPRSDRRLPSTRRREIGSWVH